MASQQWTESIEPGKAVLVQHEDGTVTVQQADPVLAVDPALLDQLDVPHLEADGTLVLDTAGEYRYQRVGEQSMQGRTMIIYRRVQRA